MVLMVHVVEKTLAWGLESLSSGFSSDTKLAH